MKIRTIFPRIDPWDQEHPNEGIYDVYSMEIYNSNSEMLKSGKITFCINNNGDYTYFDSMYFDIIDARISRFWEVKIYDSHIELGIKEWINDLDFQKKVMFDRIPSEIERWEDLLKSMMYEFNDPNLPFANRVKDDSWIECVNCSNIWQVRNYDYKIIVCPECGKLLNLV